MFKVDDRVEMATSNYKGTVIYDDGKHVKVLWDDNVIGLLEYNRSKAYSAHQLIKLAKIKIDDSKKELS